MLLCSTESLRTMKTIRLPRSFYLQRTQSVARDLLGCRLITEYEGHRSVGIIVETEAYLGTIDPASHAYRGQTRRNQAMFLEGGHIYVYFIYGMHYCFNVVTGPAGLAEAVLIRGVLPTEGMELMRQRRGITPRREADLSNGPAKLTVALGIGPELDGADLTSDPRIWIEAGTSFADEEVTTTPRIGITKAADLPLRWIVRQ